MTMCRFFHKPPHSRGDMSTSHFLKVVKSLAVPTVTTILLLHLCPSETSPLNMTISKLESLLSQFPKRRGVPVKFNSYTHAAAASQPKPLRIITASSAVISKIVDTSYVGSSPVSTIMSTKLSKRSNSSTRD